MGSPIEDLFEEIYGFRPNKKGAAYEMLSAVVCKLLAEHADIFHDQRVQALFSRGFYQADVWQQSDDGTYLAETKDYSELNRPVGRPDLTSLGGKLNDLAITSGLFFSATGYTLPAKDYAAASKEILGKEIKLVNLRVAVQRDEQGRVKAIRITFHVPHFLAEGLKFEPIFTEAARERLARLATHLRGHPEQNEVPLGDAVFDTFYDADGTRVTTADALLFDHPAQEYGERHYATVLTPGLFITVGGEMVGLRGVTVDMPVLTLEAALVLNVRGKAKLVVTKEGAATATLITDLDLKRARFRENGRVELADSEDAFQIESIESD